MAALHLWTGLHDQNLKGFTLIVPSVAVGNVGQLACDLLISSFHMKKIASAYSPALIPVLGYNPYDLNSDQLSTCCEVYKSEEKNILVLQMRAPLVLKYARSFLEEFVTELKKKGVNDVIILTSSYAHEKKHIQTSPFRFVATESCPYKKQIQSLNWLEHSCTDNAIKIYGGGFASLLYQILKEKSVACLILYKYCSEGDNIPDAYDMVQKLSGVLPLFKTETKVLTQLIQPVSWKLLFGRPAPQDIY